MIDMIENYFPQGIATGNAFIGRDKDMEWLIKNIQTGHHTLLLGVLWKNCQKGAFQPLSA